MHDFADFPLRNTNPILCSQDLPTHYEKCGEDGTWGPGSYEQFSCSPDCGLLEVPKTPYILNGVSTRRGQWPWHVAIYLKHKGAN